MKDPKIFDKFRLISLCSVAYKSCSKLLAKRMTSILHLMVSLAQGTLIPKISIFKNITLAQDLVQSLNHKSQGRNMVIKIDMFKAYDRVNWSFLLNVLTNLGFFRKFCNLVVECVQTPCYLIMMNDTYKNFFQLTRGLHQGNPLSTYLFFVMEKILF